MLLNNVNNDVHSSAITTTTARAADAVTSIKYNDHIKCGEVYTWWCEDVSYAIECHLCVDRPICPLTEYAQHMNVWHLKWENNNNNKEDEDMLQQQEDGAADVTVTNESYTIQTTEEIQRSKCEMLNNDDAAVAADIGEEENLDELHPQPFEQVLIEQDNNDLNDLYNLIDEQEEENQEQEDGENICNHVIRGEHKGEEGVEEDEQKQIQPTPTATTVKKIKTTSNPTKIQYERLQNEREKQLAIVKKSTTTSTTTTKTTITTKLSSTSTKVFKCNNINNNDNNNNNNNSPDNASWCTVTLVNNNNNNSNNKAAMMMTMTNSILNLNLPSSAAFTTKLNFINKNKIYMKNNNNYNNINNKEIKRRRRRNRYTKIYQQQQQQHQPVLLNEYVKVNKEQTVNNVKQKEVQDIQQQQSFNCLKTKFTSSNVAKKEIKNKQQQQQQQIISNANNHDFPSEIHVQLQQQQHKSVTSDIQEKRQQQQSLQNHINSYDIPNVMEEIQLQQQQQHHPNEFKHLETDFIINKIRQEDEEQEKQLSNHLLKDLKIEQNLQKQIDAIKECYRKQQQQHQQQQQQQNLFNGIETIHQHETLKSNEIVRNDKQSNEMIINDIGRQQPQQDNDHHVVNSSNNININKWEISRQFNINESKRPHNNSYNEEEKDDENQQQQPLYECKNYLHCNRVKNSNDYEINLKQEANIDRNYKHINKNKSQTYGITPKDEAATKKHCPEDLLEETLSKKAKNEETSTKISQQKECPRKNVLQEEVLTKKGTNQEVWSKKSVQEEALMKKCINKEASSNNSLQEEASTLALNKSTNKGASSQNSLQEESLASTENDLQEEAITKKGPIQAALSKEDLREEGFMKKGTNQGASPQNSLQEDTFKSKNVIGGLSTNNLQEEPLVRNKIYIQTPTKNDNLKIKLHRQDDPLTKSCKLKEALTGNCKQDQTYQIVYGPEDALTNKSKNEAPHHTSQVSSNIMQPEDTNQTNFTQFAEKIFNNITETYDLNGNTEQLERIDDNLLPTICMNYYENEIIEELFREMENYSGSDEDWLYVVENSLNGDIMEDIINGFEKPEENNNLLGMDCKTIEEKELIAETTTQYKETDELCEKGRKEENKKDTQESQLVNQREAYEQHRENVLIEEKEPEKPCATYSTDTVSTKHLLHEKLTPYYTIKLINLYKQEPCLWNESHSDFFNPLPTRKAWQNITHEWNKLCSRKFTTTDIRIKISNLCQSYLKERERLLQSGQFNGNIKFQYYHEMAFLEEQQSLQKRRELYDKQNTKIIETYRYFPLLWHRRYYKLKYTCEREKAWECIRSALKLCGYNVSRFLIQQRIRSLRKCYRLEKIRFLHTLVQNQPFEATFKHYEEMQFLHEHIDPYRCGNCNGIFENLLNYRFHFKRLDKKYNCIEEDHDLGDDEQREIIKLNKKELEEAPIATPLLQQEQQQTPLQVQVQVQYADNIINLQIPLSDDKDSTSQSSQFKDKNNNKTKPPPTDCDNSFIRLTEKEAHQLIALYKSFPQLWNPNHLDYNIRSMKRQNWQSLTRSFNESMGKKYRCHIIYRKMSDYVKYYKKEKLRLENAIKEKKEREEGSSLTMWALFEDFKFLDDVLTINQELQKCLQQKENSYKIIELYKSLPQLWDINHPDYNKHTSKQRNIQIMCQQLQQQCQLNLTPERLKQKLTEFKSQYRKAREQQPVKALKGKNYNGRQFEFYENLKFLEQHVAPFKCNVCHMQFNVYKEFNKHRRSSQCSKKMENGFIKTNQTLDNVCDICGLTFTLRSNLMVHLKRHEGVRNYPCAHCPKRFFNSHTLKVHERSHTKETPFTCEKCGHSFVDKSKLNLHLKRHTEIRDYLCEYCPRAFFTAHERDYHVRRHLNIRDKVCKVCGKTFAAGSALYAHLMLHSEVKRFQCDKCELKFAQYSGLYKHKKKHH